MTSQQSIDITPYQVTKQYRLATQLSQNSYSQNHNDTAAADQFVHLDTNMQESTPLYTNDLANCLNIQEELPFDEVDETQDNNPSTF